MAIGINTKKLASVIGTSTETIKSSVEELTEGLGGLSSPLTEDLDAGGNTITDLGDPTDPQDASTKQYVDDSVASLSGINVYSATGLSRMLISTNSYVFLDCWNGATSPGGEVDIDGGDGTIIFNVAGIYDAYIKLVIFRTDALTTEEDVFVKVVSSALDDREYGHVILTNTTFWETYIYVPKATYEINDTIQLYWGSSTGQNLECGTVSNGFADTSSEILYINKY